MKKFLGDDFLLNNSVAEELYHQHAASLPIIDYHNHLDQAAMAANHQFRNITEAWLYGDHYKWRAMRANGIDERYITGDATDKEKFNKWAETVPYTLRNPLYHWTHLELRRYFGINELLSPDTADEIYSETEALMKKDSHSCIGLLLQMNVESLCTTDDPVDDLSHHRAIKERIKAPKVYPTFRPDKALQLDGAESWLGYLQQLSDASGISIQSYDTYLEALQQRVDFFHENGCRVSDLGFHQIPDFNPQAGGLDQLFASALSGKTLNATDLDHLRGHALAALCKMYHAKGWVQQFHLGALRNNNERALRELGPDTGYDSMGDYSQAVSLSKFFNHLDNTDQLAKSIIYNLNPRDNDLFATMVGNFNDGKIVGKMQFGTGWWFLDQKNGMENQMNSLSNMGLLSRFIGMLTDSRSFLSFPRHEYFRRILCNLIGTDVINGEIPHDMDLLGKMVEDICYLNAKSYFDFKES
ncbi:glucuronate isomerase [Reichenbachiella sp.]|uniref:glucuronate isomerase n=1 Tax=Reichenbachiella sp. TaxID=2184521 RepID=UPI003B59EF02